MVNFAMRKSNTVAAKASSSGNLVNNCVIRRNAVATTLEALLMQHVAVW